MLLLCADTPVVNPWISISMQLSALKVQRCCCDVRKRCTPHMMVVRDTQRTTRNSAQTAWTILACVR